MANQSNVTNILLIEDNPGDVRLTQEALKAHEVLHRLHVVRDGVEAMAYLHQEGDFADAELPELIILDLNLPRKDGREVLADVKGDKKLKRIPIVILTTSRADEDILQTYNLNANCYVTKPLDFKEFLETVKSIENFWLEKVTLPSVH